MNLQRYNQVHGRKDNAYNAKVCCNDYYDDPFFITGTTMWHLVGEDLRTIEHIA